MAMRRVASPPAADSNELVTDLLTCKICQLPYNEPKRLPCLHTFCRACIIYQLKVNAVSAVNGDGVVCLFCPLCRQLCELPSVSGVDSLSDHQLLRTLLGTIYSGLARVCQRCSSVTNKRLALPSTSVAAHRTGNDGGSVAAIATHCCIRCEEFLCQPCMIQHQREITTSDHVIVGVDAMKERCQIASIQHFEKPIVNVKLVHQFDNTVTCSLAHSTSSAAADVTAVVSRRTPSAAASYGHRLFVDPVGMKLNEADQLMVTNSGDLTVNVISLEGRCERQIDHAGFLSRKLNDASQYPRIGCCAVTAEGYVVVAMSNDAMSTSSGSTRRVAVVESLAGRHVGDLQISGADKDINNSRPFGVATTEDGHVIVTDVGRNCVFVFDAEFQLLTRFGRRGSRNGQFKSPRYVAVSPANDILVSDYGNHYVKAFTMAGKFRYKVGGIGRDPGKFLHPAGVCTDRYGNIFVADRDNHRVQMFDKAGKFIAVVVSDTCANSTSGLDIRPLDVAVTSQTHLVVLLTGIEGVDCIQVQEYDVRCSRAPPEVRSVKEIVNSIQKLSIAGAVPATPQMTADFPSDRSHGRTKRQKVTFDLTDVLGHNGDVWGSSSKQNHDFAMNPQKERHHSQICAVS